MADSVKVLAEQIALRLKRYIIENNLSAGEKIPPEQRLAKMMGVGRGTIREAVKILESRNILDVRHGSGTFISDNIGVSDDPLGLAFIRDKSKLAWDLLEIRIIIEPSIAALAAKNALPEEIAELENICSQVEVLLRAGKDYTEKDVLFHKKIAELSKNIVVPNLIPIISVAVDLFTLLTGRKLVFETLETHREIVDAIKRHDGESAHEAMYLHLLYNKNLLRKLVKKN